MSLETELFERINKRDYVRSVSGKMRQFLGGTSLEIIVP